MAELQVQADEMDTLKLELLEARREIQELQRRARTWQVGCRLPKCVTIIVCMHASVLQGVAGRAARQPGDA